MGQGGTVLVMLAGACVHARTTTKKIQEPTCFIIFTGDQHQIFEIITLGTLKVFFQTTYHFQGLCLIVFPTPLCFHFSFTNVKYTVCEIQDYRTTNLNLST